MNKLGIVGSNIPVRGQGQQYRAARIALIERHSRTDGDCPGGEHAGACRRFEHMIVGGNRGRARCEPAQRGGRAELLHIDLRSEEHTSELQSLMRISYAVFCLKKKKTSTRTT